MKFSEFRKKLTEIYSHATTQRWTWSTFFPLTGGSACSCVRQHRRGGRGPWWRRGSVWFWGDRARVAAARFAHSGESAASSPEPWSPPCPPCSPDFPPPHPLSRPPPVPSRTRYPSCGRRRAARRGHGARKLRPRTVLTSNAVRLPPEQQPASLLPEQHPLTPSPTWSSTSPYPRAAARPSRSPRALVLTSRSSIGADRASFINRPTIQHSCAMDATNAFASPLEKWIYNRSISSIFFVNIVGKGKAAIKLRMDIVGTVEEDKRDAELNLDGKGRCCTGFVVEENTNHITILTCAHLIQHVFKSSDPISVRKANELFAVHVLCDHYELSFRRPLQSIHATRNYARATVIAINCTKDLLLLRVIRKEVMNLNRRCRNSHRALAISPSPPETFDKCAMISWPPLKPRTAVGGAVANPSRPFLDIVEEEENPVEYTMDFIQADIASETGSSGAPLLDGNGRVIGLLHGGFGGRFSYFVSHHDIVQFLMQSGILAN